MNFTHYSDEQLVSEISSGNNELLHILIERYLDIIKYKTQILCPFADADDMIQEGIIALYSAANVYDKSLSSFSTFANLCIERSLISAYRKLFSKKQVPKGETVSLDVIQKTDTSTPETVLIEKEECLAFTEKIKNSLSAFEYKVLCEYLNNSSYEIIAQNLNVEKKVVNNAMLRVRNKIKAIK